MGKTDGDERHRYGSHYTPAEVARLLAHFAVRDARDLVFDPACGDGRLLSEAARVKGHLSSSAGTGRERAAREVYGIDRSEQAVKLAARTGAQVACADFFDLEPGAKLNKRMCLPQTFDAVIGNPPYIRQEVMEAADKRRIERRLAEGRKRSPDLFWPRWSGRSDIYVYFFAHAVRFLKPGGRLVFLTASSWLDVAYGAALREFIAANFRIVAVIESGAESFFADASVNTAITVLERKARFVDDRLVRFARLAEPLREIYGRRADPAGSLARFIEQAASPITTGTHRVRMISPRELLAEEAGCLKGEGQPEAQSHGLPGWGKYLRADDVFFEVIERGRERFKPLSEMARVRFGVKTGANDFFYVKGAAERVMKPLSDMADVRRGLTTGANEFFYLKAVEGMQSPRARPGAGIIQEKGLVAVEDWSGARRKIESSFLAPVIFSLKEIESIFLDAAQSRRLLFNCSLAVDELEGKRALEYIEAGMRAGYHLRPTCLSRDPWYRVARQMKPAPLIFPSKVGERWLVALNLARAFEDKKLYGVFPREGVSSLLLAALLNSTWARYYTEVTCRQMTGAQAIADIDVAVAERILLPHPDTISDGLRSKLEAALESLGRRPVLSIFEEVDREDRRKLDLLVLAAIGFTASSERKAVLDRLYQAVTSLVCARLAKSRMAL